ncbi:hypothetical protein N0V86_007895 [Didymella sp. IMI 355093]|nr:hypothetical protein N0V86_007895 [Didymella sp. IMI 355093]
MPLGRDKSTSRKKKSVNQYRQPVFTPDEKNPLEKSFHEGYVVGYSHEDIDELIAFEKTDWVCDDDEEEPTFHQESGEIQKIDREVETLDAMLQKASVTHGGNGQQFHQPVVAD